MDIICPCDYRDSDLNEFGCCYCSLYVSYENLKDKKYRAIPERRGRISSSDKFDENSKDAVEAVKELEEDIKKQHSVPVWRCKVCGYLCAREYPPEKCPICGADADRFEKYMLNP